MSRITYDDSIAMELFCGGNQSLSNLISGDCKVDDVAEALESIYGEDGVRKKVWLQLNLIYQVAVEQGMLQINPMISAVHVIKEANRDRIYQLNAALKKPCFSDQEEARMVAFLREVVPVPAKKDLYAPRYVVESKWLAGAISLFTGLPAREICPLLWGDLTPIDDMEEMQISITKHINSSGSVISNVNYGNKTHFRKVAVDVILAKMLMARKQYLISNFGYTEESLADLPIMLETEPSGRGRRNHTMISRATLRRVNRCLLEEANIEPDIISLLEGDARFDFDMNAYRNDLFAANFRHRAIHACNFTVGELFYHVGNKASDIYDRHYCDYSNDFMQYGMVRKLYRWTYVYDTENERSLPVSMAGNVENLHEIAVGHYEKGLAKVEFTLMPEADAEGYVTVELSCEHGLTGEIIGIGREVRSCES